MRPFGTGFIGEERTNADDLSPADRYLVRNLATSLIHENLASLGIAFKERKNESPKKNSCLWGMSLESLLKLDHNHHPYAKIPIIFDEIFNLLEGRGIEVVLIKTSYTGSHYRYRRLDRGVQPPRLYTLHNRNRSFSIVNDKWTD